MRHAAQAAVDQKSRRAHNTAHTLLDFRGAHMQRYNWSSVGASIAGLLCAMICSAPASAVSDDTIRNERQQLPQRAGCWYQPTLMASADEAANALENKLGPPRNSPEHQALGNKSYFNEKTGTSYNVHTDPNHGPPHVDVKVRGSEKQEFPLKTESGN